MIGGNRVKGKMRKRRRDREHYTGRDDRDEGTIDAIRIHEAERALLSLLKGKQVDPDELYKRPRISDADGNHRYCHGSDVESLNFCYRALVLSQLRAGALNVF